MRRSRPSRAILVSLAIGLSLTTVVYVALGRAGWSLVGASLIIAALGGIGAFAADFHERRSAGVLVHQESPVNRLAPVQLSVRLLATIALALPVAIFALWAVILSEPLLVVAGTVVGGVAMAFWLGIWRLQGDRLRQGGLHW